MLILNFHKAGEYPPKISTATTYVWYMLSLHYYCLQPWRPCFMLSRNPSVLKLWTYGTVIQYEQSKYLLIISYYLLYGVSSAHLKIKLTCRRCLMDWSVTMPHSILCRLIYWCVGPTLIHCRPGVGPTYVWSQQSNSFLINLHLW